MSSLSIIDDRGRKIFLRTPPTRVISLVPSDTYSIARLGAAHLLIGRTRYCVAPPEIEHVEIVGGTKDADVDRITALAPDLVIANQEENTRRDVERLDEAGIPVLVSFPQTVAAGLNHLARLARILGLGDRAEPARSVVAAAYHALNEAERLRPTAGRVRVFVPIWMDPLMTANDGTFLSDVLALAGAINVFGDRDRRYPLAADLGRAAGFSAEKVAGLDTRYPRVTLDEVVARAPDLVLLPDEPHPFTERDAEVFRALAIPAARHGQVAFCDGKDLMWYGARSVEGLDRLRRIVETARAAASPAS